MPADGAVVVSEQHIALTTGVQLRVLQSGPETGAPVLLLHGWGASAYMWRFALQDLAAHGLRVIAPDMRGHGWSDRPGEPGEYRIERLAADIVALADHLGLERFALVGQSMGGAVALRIALELPGRVSHLALVNPAGLCDVPPIRAAHMVGSTAANLLARVPVPRWLVKFLLDRCYGDRALITDADVDAYWEPTRRPGYSHALSALLSEFDWKPLSDAALNSLGIPILLVFGTMDRVIPGGRHAAGRLRSARVLVLEGAGHTANSERPDEVDAALIDFLGGPDRVAISGSRT